MSKNILREYEDGFFDDDRFYDSFQRKTKKVTAWSDDKDQEKKQTLQRKRIRRLKEGY